MRLRSFLPFLPLILATNHAFSQTVNLTGTIKPSDGDSIELNMPFDGNYWKKNSVCPPRPKRKFPCHAPEGDALYGQLKKVIESGL